ncbi:hypothetical protein D3C86_1966380 [compost metagenome]
MMRMPIVAYQLTRIRKLKSFAKNSAAQTPQPLVAVVFQRQVLVTVVTLQNGQMYLKTLLWTGGVSITASV